MVIIVNFGWLKSLPTVEAERGLNQKTEIKF